MKIIEYFVILFLFICVSLVSWGLNNRINELEIRQQEQELVNNIGKQMIYSNLNIRELQ